jgi:leucyl/phenylalanyl-tRNA--protein transferase
MIPILSKDPESPFPPTKQALDHPQGLLAAGGDLSPTRLLNAYRHGIFPWYSDDQPILWWSPAPRCILYPSSVHVSRRLRRRYNQGQFKLTCDQAFSEVITACAEPRPDHDGTWILDEMKQAFIHLHEIGVTHSLEVWRDQKLVGGIYGVALGQIFFGESMFSKTTDASKIALVALCRQLQRWGFSLLDCQISNPHLLSMGAEDISRARFERHLKATSGPNLWGEQFSFDQRW